MRSALPTTAGVSATSVAGSLAHVDLAAAFVSTGTIEQVLAVAQIVYTVTALEGIDAVAFTLAGRPVEVPIGNGTLKDGALSRGDFSGVAQP